MRTATVLSAFFLFFFALQLAHAGYTEKIVVQAFDQSLRPIEGAQAYVNYQLNAVSGFTKTKPKATNASGEVELVFTDYEEIGDSTDKTYTLYVKYGDQLRTYGLIAGEGARRSDGFRAISETSLLSYVVHVTVTDQMGRPLAARVTAGPQTKVADASGTATFQLPLGNYSVRAELNDAARTRQVTLDADRAVSMEIDQYPLRVRVTDDARKPLGATVEVDGKLKATDTEGYAFFENISSQNVEVVVKYGESFKRLVVDLSSQPATEVTFDLTRPVIKELHAAISKSGSAVVSLYVEDQGPLASGIDTVSLSYEIDGVENKIPAYAVGYNAFEARIPARPPKTFVKYNVKVSDKEGNVVYGSGTYVVPLEGGTAPAGNGSPTTPAVVKGAPIGIEGVVIIIVVIALVAYAAVYYVMGARKGQQPPPAQGASPPATPPS